MEKDIFENFQDNIEIYINELIEEGAKLGFEFDKENISYDFDYCQGRGASFDGTVNLLTFLNSEFGKNELEENIRITLIQLLDQSFIENHVNISKNSFANHYQHEKTRFVDYIEVYDESFAISSELLNTLIFNNKLQEILEFKRMELCRSFIKKVDAYLSEKQK